MCEFCFKSAKQIKFIEGFHCESQQSLIFRSDNGSLKHVSAFQPTHHITASMYTFYFWFNTVTLTCPAEGRPLTRA